MNYKKLKNKIINEAPYHFTKTYKNAEFWEIDTFLNTQYNNKFKLYFNMNVEHIRYIDIDYDDLWMFHNDKWYFCKRDVSELHKDISYYQRVGLEPVNLHLENKKIIYEFVDDMFMISMALLFNFESFPCVLHFKPKEKKYLPSPLNKIVNKEYRILRETG